MLIHCFRVLPQKFLVAALGWNCNQLLTYEFSPALTLLLITSCSAKVMVSLVFRYGHMLVTQAIAEQLFL